MTDKEFISGMWNKVEALSRSEAEIQRTVAISKELKRKERIQILFVVMGIFAIFCVVFYLSEFFANFLTAIVPILSVMMIAAFYVDSRQHTASQNENGGDTTYG